MIKPRLCFLLNSLFYCSHPSQPGFSAHKGAPTSDLRELILQEKTWVSHKRGHIGLIDCRDVIVLGPVTCFIWVCELGTCHSDS